MKNYLATNKAALDTNILIHACRNDGQLFKKVAIEILTIDNLHISHFVVFEFLKSKGSMMHEKEALRFINRLVEVVKFNECNKETYDLAYFLVKRYDCTLPDSLIVADAILNNCSVLYTRDMQHNQVYERKVRIINPFVWIK